MPALIIALSPIADLVAIGLAGFLIGVTVLGVAVLRASALAERRAERMREAERDRQILESWFDHE